MLLGEAWAALPAGLYPFAVPWDTPDAYATWRAAEGLLPVTLLCEETWSQQVRVCVRRVAEGRRQWVTVEDAATWQTERDEVWRSLRVAAQPHLAEIETRMVEDMPVPYLVLRDGLGWAVGALWYPEELAKRLQVQRVHVAMPTDGILMAWAPGNPAADKVLATAVTQLYEEGGSKHGVSPVVHTWTGTQWVQFAEAKRQP